MAGKQFTVVSILIFVCCQLFLCTVASSIGGHTNDSVSLENIDCYPHLKSVKTDPDSHQYFPHFVWLHRCQGSWETLSPQFMACAPVQEAIETVNVQVTRVDDANFNDTIPMKNHTKCKKECVKDKSVCGPYEDWVEGGCRCECRFGQNDPEIPDCSETGKVWAGCNCVCPKRPTGSQTCGPLKVWSDETCSCVCKETVCSGYFDEDTCLCVGGRTKDRNSENCIQFEIVLVGFFVEACLLVFVIIVIYKCLYTKFCTHLLKSQKNNVLFNQVEGQDNYEVQMTNVVVDEGRVMLT